MLLPLVVLAVGAFAGGVINLPFGDLDFLHHWLEPVVEGSERTLGRDRRGLQVGPPRPRRPCRHPQHHPG